MTNQETIRHLENMKWLKGYDNTAVGGVPIGDIIDQIIVLLEEQKAEIEQLNRFVNGFSRDAMPVVRCKDCRFAHLTYDGSCKQCEKAIDDDDRMLTLYLPGDFFCGYGERKDGEQDE